MLSASAAGRLAWAWREEGGGGGGCLYLTFDIAHAVLLCVHVVEHMCHWSKRVKI